MESRQNGEFRRSLISALAAMVAAAVPTLIPSAALAEKNPEPRETPAAGKESKAAPAKDAKKAKKATAGKAQKAPAHKLSKTAKADDAQPKADAKGKATASKAKKAKKTTAARAPAAKKKAAPAKKADSEAPGRPCTGTSISVDRGGLEAQTLALVDCRDRPLDKADEALSVLARPWGAARPANLHGKAAKKDPRRAVGEIAPGVKLLDKGLLTRLAAIARRYPGKPFSLVSGYRPQSRGSLHQHARALDLRVAGVTNEELSSFCKTLEDTGCGYYPNSSFVHVDVRDRGTGTVSWIDTSGPGEAPHYVKQWPPPPDLSDTAVLPPDGAQGGPSGKDADDEHRTRQVADDDPGLP